MKRDEKNIEARGAANVHQESSAAVTVKQQVKTAAGAVNGQQTKVMVPETNTQQVTRAAAANGQRKVSAAAVRVRKTAVVIGASGGIGESVATAFFKKGYNVVCGYHFNQMAAEALADRLMAARAGKMNRAAAGGDVMSERVGKMNRAAAVGVDVTDEQSVAAFFDAVAKTFGCVDVLVNAGGVSRPNLLIDVKKEDICAEVGTNLVGVMLTCREAAKIMMRFGGGRIINIASVWGVVGAAVESTYSGAKAGVIGFSRALSKELGGANITVNCISPGAVKTAMTAHLSKADFDAIKRESPIEKMVTPKAIAQTAVFLAGSAGEFITGQNIVVDCGWTA